MVKRDYIKIMSTIDVGAVGIHISKGCVVLWAWISGLSLVSHTGLASRMGLIKEQISSQWNTKFEVRLRDVVYRFVPFCMQSQDWYVLPYILRKGIKTLSLFVNKHIWNMTDIHLKIKMRVWQITLQLSVVTCHKPASSGKTGLGLNKTCLDDTRNLCKICKMRTNHSLCNHWIFSSIVDYSQQARDGRYYYLTSDKMQYLQSIMWHIPYQPVSSQIDLAQLYNRVTAYIILF